MWRHSFYAVLAASIVVILSTGAAIAAEAVNIGYVNVMDDAQVMVANDGGFYEAHGLEPQLIKFASGTDLIKGIVSGQLDVGILGFSNAFTWVSRGADLKIVGGAQMGYHSILARRDSGIESVSDLQAHTLASQKQGSTADIVLTGVTLAAADLTKQDLNMIYTSPAVAVQSLVSGRVDAAFLFEPYDRIARATAPVKEIYEVGKVWPFPCMVVITSQKSLETKGSLITRVLDAQKEAIRLLQQEPRRAAELIAHRFIATESLGTPAGPIPAVDIITEAVKSQSFNWKITQSDIDRMTELAHIMEDQGILAAPIDVADILDLTWQEQFD